MTVESRGRGPSAGAQADAVLGRAVESAFRLHHRRRLTRLGWRTALDSGGDLPHDIVTFPPRQGNQVDVLVDGSETFAAMLAAISGARRGVQIAGWHATPLFMLTRGTDGTSLADVLAHAAARATVRVLLWRGSALPVIHPTRSDARVARDGFARIPGVSVALDDHEYPLHCHHEKVVIVDDEMAFVGGLDLTDLNADRWDTTAHEPRDALGWHDVATRLQGPVVADVAAHFAARWTAVTGESLPPPRPSSPSGPHTVQLVRTVPEKVYPFRPDGDFTILASYRRALASAEHLIYLENQFLWAPEIVDLLEEKLLRPPAADFRLVLLLPSRPSSGRDTTLGQLSRLVEADVDRRLLAATLQPMAAGSPGTYVHAKVGIVDDRWLTIGSANLNAHSLLNDTETNVVLTDPELIADTRRRLWAEHLGVAEMDPDPVRVIDELWVPTAREQLRRSRNGLPPTHRLCELAGVGPRRDLVLGGLVGLLVDG